MLSRDDFNAKQILVIHSDGSEKLSYRNSNLVVLNKDGSIKYQISCYRVFLIMILGEISVTSGMIKHAKHFGYAILLFSTSFRLYAVFGTRMEGNTLLHRKQYEYSGNDLAAWIVTNKFHSQRKVLSGLRNKSYDCRSAIFKFDQYLAELRSTVPDLSRLRGMEGTAAHQYFKAVFEDCSWKSRRPREKKDLINSSLDVGYTILFHFVDSLLQLYDFDTYCGIYHREFYMRKSLVCDIMEPMRPIIDYALRKGIHLGTVTEGDFQIIQGQYRLQYQYSKKYTSLFLKSVLDRKEDIFLFVRDYYRSFMKGRNICDFPYLEAVE